MGRQARRPPARRAAGHRHLARRWSRHATACEALRAWWCRRNGRPTGDPSGTMPVEPAPVW